MIAALAEEVAEAALREPRTPHALASELERCSQACDDAGVLNRACEVLVRRADLL